MQVLFGCAIIGLGAFLLAAAADEDVGESVYNTAVHGKWWQYVLALVILGIGIALAGWAEFERIELSEPLANVRVVSWRLLRCKECVCLATSRFSCVVCTCKLIDSVFLSLFLSRQDDRCVSTIGGFALCCVVPRGVCRASILVPLVFPRLLRPWFTTVRRYARFVQGSLAAGKMPFEDRRFFAIQLRFRDGKTYNVLEVRNENRERVRLRNIAAWLEAAGFDHVQAYAEEEEVEAGGRYDPDSPHSDDDHRRERDEEDRVPGSPTRGAERV